MENKIYDDHIALTLTLQRQMMCNTMFAFGRTAMVNRTLKNELLYSIGVLIAPIIYVPKS